MRRFLLSMVLQKVRKKYAKAKHFLLRRNIGTIKAAATDDDHAKKSYGVIEKRL